MKKKWWWSPVDNNKNHFLFGAYGRDVYIKPGVEIHRPRFVHIGAGYFIASNACILPNVTIGCHTIIGANSIVKGGIPTYSVVVGAPARVIKRYDLDLKQWVRVDE